MITFTNGAHFSPSLRDDAPEQAEVPREGLQLQHEAARVHVRGGAHLQRQARLVARFGSLRGAQSVTVTHCRR